MTNAKRRINSTGRKRIRRDEVDIRMLEVHAGEPLKAKASLSLDSHNFRPDSRVSIEAYHRSSGMRFDCGTVGALKIPALLVLDEVDRSGTVLFRVKVTEADGDVGKLLGSAERIQPTSEETIDGKRSLFPVVYRDLKEQVWKVEILDGGRPKLILNCEIPGIGNKLHQNALIQAFLFPAALRIVLEKLVLTDDDGDDEEPGWKAEWLQFCKGAMGIHDDPEMLDDEGKAEWIERVLNNFCSTYKFMDGIRKMDGDGEIL